MGCFYGWFIHINEVVMWFINKIIVIIIIIIIIIIITTTLRQLLTNVKDRDEPNNRQGASTRSNAPTARLPILVRLAETLTRD